MTLRLGDILVEKRIITPEELKLAIAEQKKTGEMLGQVLVKMHIVSERRMLEVIAEQQGLTFLDIKEVTIADNVIKTVPAKFVWHYNIMPISIESNTLTIAVSNPFDMWPVDDLEANLGYRVDRVIAMSSDIQEAITKYYGVGADTIEQILSKGSDEGKKKPRAAAGTENVEDLEKLAGDASVIKLVNQILQQAINDRTTDIHIEHFRDDIFLRYRIDGILYDMQINEDIKYLYPPIVSRVKVMSGLDIIERRIPQDGRAKVKIGEKEYDLRVSIIPTIHGESIVIRILPTTMLFNMADLGMYEQDQKILAELLKKPHGIIFVTGPTGSGKSTTLYSCLSKLNTRDRKIITVEDPVEYELKGITQIHVNPKIGLTFAQSLRSMLRHDPDVMMVGEVRDFETAEITIRTALTGHLVFSTLHTNDAASGVTRLIDIGVEPYLVASSVAVFIAQRLVRVICDKCKKSVKIPASLKQALDTEELKPISGNVREIFQGAGCKACNNTGYMGRTGIYEFLMIDEEIKKLIFKKSYSDLIKDKAVELGMRTLKQDGCRKVLDGITTFDEVIRVTQ